MLKVGEGMARILSKLSMRGRRGRIERADFISSNAMFYKVLGREKNKRFPKVPNKIDHK